MPLFLPGNRRDVMRNGLDLLVAKALFDRIESQQYPSPQRRLGSPAAEQLAPAKGMPAFAGMTCFWSRFELIGLRSKQAGY